MAEIEVGRGKTGRRSFGLAQISLAPTRRTRDVADVDLSWKIDAYLFELPLLGAGVPGAMSIDDAVAIAGRGAFSLIDLDHLWAGESSMEILHETVAKIRASDGRVAARVSVGKARELVPHAIAAETDLVVIESSVLSADHVSTIAEPLDLTDFIRGLDVPVIAGGCASYSAALHLMRTGAAGVIVGVDRPDLGVSVPLATAIADARAARVRHLDETGVYCHLIARGQIVNGADVAKAIACGADAVLVDPALILSTDEPHGDVVGDLSEAIAACGYTDLKSFQKVEVVTS